MSRHQPRAPINDAIPNRLEIGDIVKQLKRKKAGGASGIVGEELQLWYDQWETLITQKINHNQRGQSNTRQQIDNTNP